MQNFLAHHKRLFHSFSCMIALHRIGKLMLFGAIFRCLDPALTIAATLSYKSPFVCTFLISFSVNYVYIFQEILVKHSYNEVDGQFCLL